jgi:hypothetical protein
MSRRRKRTILYSSPLVVLVVAILWGIVKMKSIEADAQSLAKTGQSAIKLLGEYRAGVEKNDAAQVMTCYDDGYASEREGFWREEFKSERDGVRVYEWKQDGMRAFHKNDIADQVSRHLKTIAKLEEGKFKLDAVEQILSPESAVIRSFLWLRGVKAAGATFESQVMFRMWIRMTGDAWKIYKKELLHGETVTGDRKGFTDITKEAGIDFISHHNPTWSQPGWESKKFGIVKYAIGGVAAVDYDNDGWDDIFFGDGTEPRLYRNNGDGTFSNVTTRVGLPEKLVGVSVGVFADFDNDGDKDLFLGCANGPNRLYRNNGPGENGAYTFTDVTEGAGLGGYFTTVAAAADYDNDGRLDLYFGRYLDPRTELPTTLFYTRNSQGNTLLHNDGALRFTDVTAKAGVREGGLTLGVAWGDYDEDGDQDLYVVNDFGRKTLFRNNGDGRFSDVSMDTNTLDPGYGMSSTFGDIDNDGDLDIYVSNVHSGQRWYGQAVTFHQYLMTSVKQGTIFEDFPLYNEIRRISGSDWNAFGQRVIKGNSLLINDGKGHFTDVSEEARANPFGWYWSSTMFDYDNDSRQDIYAVNGWISGKKKDDL